MGTITVITSGKGGVGKSVFTAGLGYALAGRGRRVLLVDCDAGLRSLDYMLGIGEKLVFDLADLVKGSCRPADAVYESPVKGLYLLPAPLETEDVVSPRLMKPLIHAFAPYYDHIVIDCPAGRLRSGRQRNCGGEYGSGLYPKFSKGGQAAAGSRHPGNPPGDQPVFGKKLPPAQLL